MAYITAGQGPRTLLWIRGRPGSTVPQGPALRLLSRQFLTPLLDAGYTVWVVTRRPRLPRGVRVEDMAEDYAAVLQDQLAGHVELLLGDTFGGFLAQYLAAAHPDALDRLALVNTAAQISDWGTDVDTRIASGLAAGDLGTAGTVMAEAVLPGRPLAIARRVVGPALLNGLLAGCSAEDYVVELQAEVAFDASPVLTRITAPTLLVCGALDPFFTRAQVDQTAARIPNCDLRRYPGYGFLRSRFSSRFVHDIVEFSGSKPQPS
jgi:pimeloyl-ACP methyl ester carboxylesterase